MTSKYPKGHLSAKLVVDNGDGSSTWLSYDTRGQTVSPNGRIAVFDSSTGMYEMFDNLEAAHNRMQDHIKRITPPVNIPSTPTKAELSRKNRAIVKGRRLRNSIPWKLKTS